MSKDNIITIDNKDYNFNELNDTAQRLILRIQDYNKKTNLLQLEIDEVKIIVDNYLDKLRKEIEDAKPILQQDTQAENNSGKES